MISQNLQKALISNFACKERVLGGRAPLFFYFFLFFKCAKFDFCLDMNSQSLPAHNPVTMMRISVRRCCFVINSPKMIFIVNARITRGAKLTSATQSPGPNFDL